MFSNKKKYASTYIFNRNDFIDNSQLPNVTVVDSSGNSLNAADFVLKSGDVVTGLLQFSGEGKAIYSDGTIQEQL